MANDALLIVAGFEAFSVEGSNEAIGLIIRSVPDIAIPFEEATSSPPYCMLKRQIVELRDFLGEALQHLEKTSKSEKH